MAQEASRLTVDGSQSTANILMLILPVTDKAIKEAIRVLRKGGVVVFPTETSYGIGCDATNARAVRRVFQIKQRPLDKGMPLLVRSIASARRYVQFAGLASRLASRYWPGPLTLVLPQRRGTSLVKQVTHAGTVAMRQSPHPVSTKLVHGLRKPLVATSANISGAPAAYSVPAFLKQMERASPRPDLILDAGRIPKRAPSTIVRVHDDQIEVLRKGSLRVSL